MPGIGNFLLNLFFKKKNQPNLKKRSVLYIDDNEFDRTYIEKILTKRNYHVLLCSDGESGLEMIQKERPDLVLLDFMLPGLNGAEICRRVKTEEETKNIPVIFLTGVETPQNLIDSYKNGADDFLNKSITPKLLINRIEMTLADYIDLPATTNAS